jgi:hypothetical protein
MKLGTCCFEFEDYHFYKKIGAASEKNLELAAPITNAE